MWAFTFSGRLERESICYSDKGTIKHACHLVQCIRHPPIVAEDHAQIFEFLHILKRSAIVAKHQWFETKEGHYFCLVHIQRLPFKGQLITQSAGESCRFGICRDGAAGYEQYW